VQGSGPTGQRILQIHPTLRCNLQCVHCYSSSGPWIRDHLALDLVVAAVTDAIRIGCGALSVSGGEPFLYPGLKDVLAVAHCGGMKTSVTSNGYFLGEKHLGPLREHLDALAVSVDGPPQIHNALRGSPKAFDHLTAGLEHLRAAGIPFGFIHTLTRESWVHLVWLAEFAVASGARLLQIHALERAGRADSLAAILADEEVRSKSYLLAVALAHKYAGMLEIQIDLLHRDHVLANPELVYARNQSTDAVSTAPSAPGVLVLESDGTIVPITYGFSRHYQVCNVRERSLIAAWPKFLETTAPRFIGLCQAVFERLIATEAEPLFNWHELVCAESHAVVEAAI
jgi:MoaA/NifB/PqqE/SkfB family radical SAM enzyme